MTWLNLIYFACRFKLQLIRNTNCLKTNLSMTGTETKKSLSLSFTCASSHGIVCSGAQEKNWSGVFSGHSSTRCRIVFLGQSGVHVTACQRQQCSRHATCRPGKTFPGACSPACRPQKPRQLQPSCSWDTAAVTCPFPSIGDFQLRLLHLQKRGPWDPAALLPSDAGRKCPVECQRTFTTYHSKVKSLSLTLATS